MHPVNGGLGGKGFPYPHSPSPGWPLAPGCPRPEELAFLKGGSLASPSFSRYREEGGWFVTSAQIQHLT